MTSKIIVCLKIINSISNILLNVDGQISLSFGFLVIQPLLRNEPASSIFSQEEEIFFSFLKICVLLIYFGSGIVFIPGNIAIAALPFTLNFDASHLSSGIYFYTLEAPEIRITRKMMLVR